MMKPLLLIVVLSFCFSAHAQRAHATPYLIVRILQAQDSFNKKTFWKIQADEGNQNAVEIYQLHPYTAHSFTDGSGVSFFEPKKGMAKSNDTPPFFNYFSSPTVALNFMVQKGWRLVTVINETTTAPKYWNGALYADVATTPVYYLKWLTFENSF